MLLFLAFVTISFASATTFDTTNTFFFGGIIYEGTEIGVNIFNECIV